MFVGDVDHLQRCWWSLCRITRFHFVRQAIRRFHQLLLDFCFFYWIFNFACGHCAVLWNSYKNKRKLLGAIGRVYRKCCGFTAKQRRPSMMTTRSFLLLFFVLSRNALHSHLLLLISPCVSVYVSFLLFHPSRNDCLCGFPTQIQRGAPPTLGTLF